MVDLATAREQDNGRFSQAFRSTLPLLLFASVSLFAYLGMLWLHNSEGSLRAAQTPKTVVLYLIAFAGFAGSLWWSERVGRLSMSLIWLAAILFRLILIFTTPTLSDDVYRYLWDGYLLNQGVSPYAYSINAPELDSLAVPLRALANHGWMASPYLPAAQGLFASVTAVFPLHPFFMQVVTVLLDLANGALIIVLLAIAALPLRRVMIYLWNPLVVIEAAHSAHIDIWMITLTLLAVWLALKLGRSTLEAAGWDIGRLLSAITLAMATMTKVLPALLLPIFVARGRWKFLFVYGVTLVAVLLPFGAWSGWGISGDLDGRGLFGALRIYGDQWQFNSGIYQWLEQLFMQADLPSPDRTAKGIVGACMAAVLILSWWLARGTDSARGLLRLMTLPFMAYLLLTPTLHPWYLLILIAFLPFLPPGRDESPRRWWLLAPWLYLSATVFLSYLTYSNPQEFRELTWVRNLIWVPTLILVGNSAFNWYRLRDDG